MDHYQTESRLDEENILHSDADMGAAEEPKEENPASVGGWRFLAVLFALLAVGGLFLGLLGRVLSFVQPVAMFSAYGATLNGSLVGYAIDYLKNFFANASVIFSGGAAAVLSSLTELLLVVCLIVAAVFSVVAFIVSLVSKKRAKKIAVASGVLVFLAYTGLFLWSYFSTSCAYTMMGATAPTREICDIPTAIVGTAALALLAIGAVVSERRCAANVLLLLVPLLAAFVTSYPGTLTVIVSFDILSFGTYAFVKIALLFFMVVIAFNVLVSAIRITSAKKHGFDCFRFALLLLGAVLTVIAFIATPVTESRWTIFQGTQLFCTIGFLFLCLLGLIVSVLLTVLARRTAGAGEETGDEEIFETFAPAETSRPTETVAPLPAQTSDDREAVQLSFDNIARKEAPISEFERRMEALARGEQPDAPQPVPQTQPVQPYITSSVRAGAQRASAGYADANQYTYDPFINNLSPQEKNEFGDLFIACKAGKFEGLPTYVIGGNNDEFFRKVFIYLGKFRKDISGELLDKLYGFVSKIG